MDISTAHKGKPHISAEMWAELNRGITGNESYVMEGGQKFKSELVSNNLLKIYDGSGMMQGRHVFIPVGQSDELTIENGNQGMKRIDLVVVRYTKNENTKIEDTETIVIKGTPSESNPVAPAHIEGDIRAGDMKADWPLYEVELDGISVVEVRPLFKVLMNMSMINKRLSDTSYEIIKSSNGYVKKYKNGWFESFIQTITNNSDFAWNQIGTTGLYYAKFSNFGFGITATKILNMQMSVSNNGVIWGACPSLNASNSSINGLVVQFGRDTSRSTTIHAYVVGHWK